MKKDQPSEQSNEKNKESPLTRKIKYSPFNLRLLASLIDVLPILILTLPLWSWVENRIYDPVNPNNFLAILNEALPPEQVYSALWEQIVQQHMIERTILVHLAQVTLLALYILPCWLRFNSTPGKMLFGIEIRDAVTHEFMTTRQKFVRFFSYVLSGAPMALGFLWMLFNRKRQCWHDKISGTVVVVKEKRLFSLTLKSKSA